VKDLLLEAAGACLPKAPTPTWAAVEITVLDHGDGTSFHVDVPDGDDDYCYDNTPQRSDGAIYLIIFIIIFK
jgi:hypothetical protein